MATQPEPQTDNETGDRKALTIPVRLPYPQQAKDLFGIDRISWRALTEAIFPAALTPEAILLALAYCKARNLDPFKKQCHIVPVWDSKKRAYVETVWPGIAELRTTAARTGVYAGCDEAVIGPIVETHFKDKVRDGKDGWKTIEAVVTHPEWIQVTVYKIVQGIRCAFPGPKTRYTELMAGEKNSKVPNARWQKAPFGQLEKCAEAAALRKAFPEEIGDVGIAEDAHIYTGGDTVEGELVKHNEATQKPTREGVRAQLAQAGNAVSDGINEQLAEEQARQMDRQFAETVGDAGDGQPSQTHQQTSETQPQAAGGVSSHRTSESPADGSPPKDDAGPEAASSSPQDGGEDPADAERSAQMERMVAITDKLRAAKTLREVDQIMSIHADIIASLDPTLQQTVKAAAEGRRAELQEQING